MDERSRHRLLRLAAAACAVLIPVSTPAAARAEARARAEASAIADTTWVDADGRPIPQPPDWEPGFYGRMFRVHLADPLSHVFDIPDKILLAAKPFGVHRRHEAANVNA